MGQVGCVLLGLSAALLPGCTRTYDGTVVPTYQFAFTRQTVIPMVTLERTPTDPPARRMSFPPAPIVQAPRIEPEPPAPPRSVRRPRRAAVQPVAAEQMVHRCERVSPPSGARVVMSCG